MAPTDGEHMTNDAQTEMPAVEELERILRAPGAPPRITLDLTNSDGPLEGVMHAELDQHGNLVITKVG